MLDFFLASRKPLKWGLIAGGKAPVLQGLRRVCRACALQVALQVASFTTQIAQGGRAGLSMAHPGDIDRQTG